LYAVGWSDLRKSSQIAQKLSQGKPVCGPSEFEIRAWDIESDDTREIAERYDIANANIPNAIRANKGISVYPDGVLVLPESEEGRGWGGAKLCVSVPDAVERRCRARLPTQFRARPATVYHLLRLVPHEGVWWSPSARGVHRGRQTQSFALRQPASPRRTADAELGSAPVGAANCTKIVRV
jgi:hypothetical protein